MTRDAKDHPESARNDQPGHVPTSAADHLPPSPEWRLGFGEPTPTSGWDPDIADIEGRIVVTWPRGRVPVVVWPDVIEGWADSVNRGRAEVERLRGMLAEVAPYAIAGAEALDFHEPYGDAEGAERERLCETASGMLARLRPGGDIRREAGL